MDDIEIMIREVAGKDSSVLCREVTFIGDAMDVIRSKWVPEILTAVICGETRFKDIQASFPGKKASLLSLMRQSNMATMTGLRPSVKARGHYEHAFFQWHQLPAL